MQKLLYILFFFVTLSTVGQTQTLTNTYVDRCTGETKIVSINFINGSATVAFYNKVRTFTWVEYTNGTLKNWLDETYVWWSNLSPCSTNTANQQTTQQTTNNATSNATNAASNATSNATNTTGTSSTNNTSNTNSSSSSTSSNNPNSNSESGNSNNESNNSSGEGSSESGEGSSGENNSEGEESNSENKEEEKKEEEKEEKQEEEKEEKKEEKKKRNPIAVAANLMTQQALDGTFSRAASFGFSQSSLTGTTTYAANIMVWDNLQQFSLNLSQSYVYFNLDREVKMYLFNPKTKKEDLYFGSYYTKGSIMMIQSISANFMYIYGTKVLSFGLSNVFLGQKENFWKGFVGGYALSGTIINIDNTVMIMPSGVLFGTKPFPTKKVIISPMLALAINPVSYSFNVKGNILKGDIVWNEHVTYIIGSNFDVGLTQRFRFNIGGNIVGTTLPGIPLTWSATIGSKFQF